MDRRGNFEDGFENNWKDAFDGVSETPPSRVWAEIDRELLQKQVQSYKSKNSIYKWGMAAAVLLASFLGIAQYLYFSDQPARRLSGIVTIDQPSYNSPEIALRANDINDNQSSFLSRKLPAAAIGSSEEEDKFRLVDFEALEMKSLNPNIAVASNTQKDLFRVPVYNYGTPTSKRSKENEKFWAGVNVGSGSFDPNYQSENNTLSTSNSQSFSSFNDRSVNSSEPSLREGMSSGESVALGINFGMKLNDRWSIESGIQYARADATTTTNVVIESSRVREVIPASAEIRSIPQVENILDSEEGELNINLMDVDLANQFQFATVPVRAGYLVVNDNKFRVQLNAGFAANLYLGNKLTDPDNEIANITIGPGESSPYRELSFSGLAGVEFGYELFNRFDLVLEPNFRQSISSLTKDNSSFTANPSGFGIMTGIRYKFN